MLRAQMSNSDSSTEVQATAQLNCFPESYSSWLSGDTAPTATAETEMTWNRLAVRFADSQPNNNSFALHPAAAPQRLTSTPNGPDCHETSSHL